jgi:hypothetical protein
MKNTRISRLVLKLGVLGVFVYGTLVALGSFVLFGCWCIPERQTLRPTPTSVAPATMPTDTTSQGAATKKD